MSNANGLQRKQKSFNVIHVEGMAKVTFYCSVHILTLKHNNTSVYITANIMTDVITNSQLTVNWGSSEVQSVFPAFTTIQGRVVSDSILQSL
jgi:hypothetical protein